MFIIDSIKFVCYNSKQAMLNIISILLVISTALCVLDPAHFSDELHSILPKQMTIINQDLGRTVNGFNVQAYGITAIPNIPEQVHLSDLGHYSSSIITSYMHGTDENAANLLYGYTVNILRNFEDDYYMRNVLTHGIVWLVPFISIDAYQLTQKNKSQNSKPLKIDTSKQAIEVPEEHPRKGSMKNMNKYPDQSKLPLIDCQKTTPDKYSGVNLNYNFLKQTGQQYADVCDNSYAGPQPISERQSIAIQKLFKLLKVTAVIDLQIGDDVWVVPHADIWQNQQNKHPYSYLYKDITKKLTKLQKMYTQQQTQILKKSSKTKFDKYTGGFVNWAALNNALAFKYLISVQKSGQKLKKSVNAAFSVMDMIIKKNAPIYNKYRSEDSLKLYIQSISLNDFSIRCEIIFGNQENITKDYEVGMGKLVEVSVQVEQFRYKGFNKEVQYRPDPEVRLYVRGTLIAEVVSMDKLPFVSELPAQQNPYLKHVQPRSHGGIPSQAMLVIAFVVLAPILVGSLLLMIRKRPHHHYQQLRQPNETSF